jgi:hypothetical protein
MMKRKNANALQNPPINPPTEYAKSVGFSPSELNPGNNTQATTNGATKYTIDTTKTTMNNRTSPSCIAVASIRF